jgi:hypothetical protein
MEYIYIIKTRESIRLNEDVYKIGRTAQEHTKRSIGYPKGSIIMLQKYVFDKSKQIEALIKETLKQKFKQRIDMGIEYFEGQYSLIEKNILNIIEQNINTNQIIINCNEIEHDNNNNDKHYDEQQIKNIFPMYKDDVSFGGTKKLYKIKIFNKKNMKFCTITSYSLNKYKSGDIEIYEHEYYIGKDYSNIGHNYFKKIIQKKILDENICYDFNFLDVQSQFQNHKFILNNVIFYNENKIIEMDKQQTNDRKYIFTDTMINNKYYTDTYINDRNNYCLYVDKYHENGTSLVELININNMYIDEIYIRKFLPYIFEIFESENKLYFINRDYEYINMDNYTLNEKNKRIRVYLYNDNTNPTRSKKNYNDYIDNYMLNLKLNFDIINKNIKTQYLIDLGKIS